MARAFEGLQPSGAADLVRESNPVITDAPPDVSGDLPERRSRRPRLMAIGLIALLLVGGVAAKAFWPEKKVDVRAGTTLVTAEGMAARYGINVTLIGVTAAGGLIDFRYQVVDPDKANPIIHDVGLLPKLVVEDTGATLALTSLPHHSGTELELGGTYFFLFANANNAISRGALVTLVIGDARLEHIVAQG
ncbi:MAG: hypothetical protein OER95_07790 [Acidimicrobiia bacterium]|nr:hypothetical protein [Acidimicrobiia bacterium]